uniref:Uncharacterized protein n=1 Tax=Thermogemmatispora argillosa TaxID=2045280 RepID=A0A455T4I8_9CHLR|nr:hypothetical protein KTA_15940 [Thermogemmatispora argillosa]
MAEQQPGVDEPLDMLGRKQSIGGASLEVAGADAKGDLEADRGGFENLKIEGDVEQRELDRTLCQVRELFPGEEGISMAEVVAQGVGMEPVVIRFAKAESDAVRVPEAQEVREELAPAASLARDDQATGAVIVFHTNEPPDKGCL